MLAEGFIPTEARYGHRLVSVSITGGFFKQTSALLADDVFPGRLLKDKNFSSLFVVTAAGCCAVWRP